MNATLRKGQRDCTALQTTLTSLALSSIDENSAPGIGRNQNRVTSGVYDKGHTRLSITFIVGGGKGCRADRLPASRLPFASLISYLAPFCSAVAMRLKETAWLRTALLSPALHSQGSSGKNRRLEQALLDVPSAEQVRHGSLFRCPSCMLLEAKNESAICGLPADYSSGISTHFELSSSAPSIHRR
jgi:hypothetical protein